MSSMDVFNSPDRPATADSGPVPPASSASHCEAEC